MQTQLTSRPTSWTSLLQQLINRADSDFGRHRGLLAGLHRRIRSSLYLSTTRRAQLQATLIATGSEGGDSGAEACDTEDNDLEVVDKWWAELKRHMDLGNADSEGHASTDAVRDRPCPL